MEWYAGINGNCEIPDSATFFVVRSWEHDRGGPATCIPASGITQGPYCCWDDIYDNGTISSSEDCLREIGRGSAKVIAGCCRFWDIDACMGEPFGKISEGVCDQQIGFTSFICVSNLF